jgi:prephenate dehydrogenase
MAYALSLVHLLNMSFISALTKGVGVKEFKKIATPMGSSQLRLGQAVLSQEPALFSHIQVENPFVPGVLSDVISELENARRMAQTNDSSGFEKRFAALSGEFKREELDDALRTVYGIS